MLPCHNWLSSQTFPVWRSAIEWTMASPDPLPRCARRGRTFRTDAVVAVGGIGVGVGAGGNAPHALTDSTTSPKPITNRNDRWRFMVCSSRLSWYDRELADPPRLPRAAQRQSSPDAMKRNGISVRCNALLYAVPYSFFCPFASAKILRI